MQRKRDELKDNTRCRQAIGKEINRVLTEAMGDEKILRSSSVRFKNVGKRKRFSRERRGKRCNDRKLKR